MLFPRPACPGDRFPVVIRSPYCRSVAAAWYGCADRFPKIPIKNRGYVPRLYSIGFPSLSVQVMDTHPPKAAAMACNSFTVHPSRLNLFEKFWRLWPVAAARSESDTPARLANRRICSLVVNSIAVYPLARNGTPFQAMCQIILKKVNPMCKKLLTHYI